MEFKDVVKMRRSVRTYDKSKDVTDAQLEELFEMVKFSPSSYNLQPAEFIVIRDKAVKSRLKKCARNQQHVEDASAVIVVLGNLKPVKNAAIISADRMKKGLMDDEKKKRFDAAVDKISADSQEGLVWALRSTPLAAMTLMLAAQNMGLATCPMEGFDHDGVRAELAIPPEYELVMMITLGYGSDEKERPLRFGYDHLVHQEKFK